MALGLVPNQSVHGKYNLISIWFKKISLCVSTHKWPKCALFFVEVIHWENYINVKRFHSNLMGYERGDSFPFDFETNGVPFGSKAKGKLSPWSYPIQCEWKWKYSSLRVVFPVRIIKGTTAEYKLACWNFCHRASEKLALLGKMGPPLEPPPCTPYCCGVPGVSGPQWCRETPLSGYLTTDGCVEVPQKSWPMLNI